VTPGSADLSTHPERYYTVVAVLPPVCAWWICSSSVSPACAHARTPLKVARCERSRAKPLSLTASRWSLARLSKHKPFRAGLLSKRDMNVSHNITSAGNQLLPEGRRIWLRQYQPVLVLRRYHWNSVQITPSSCRVKSDKTAQLHQALVQAHAGVCQCPFSWLRGDLGIVPTPSRAFICVAQGTTVAEHAVGEMSTVRRERYAKSFFPEQS